MQTSNRPFRAAMAVLAWLAAGMLAVNAVGVGEAAADLATFDAAYGLPAPYSFKKISQTGSTSLLPPPDPNWALEAALDVEWAHAIAPQAGILLVEAKSSSLSDLNAAIYYASRQSS